MERLFGCCRWSWCWFSGVVDRLFWCSYCGLVLRDNNDNIVAIENPYNGGSFYGLAGGYNELRTLEICLVTFDFE